ncbi:MAG: thiamine phosphate synthase [Candidatus Caldarchaeum sp.]
MWEAPEPPIMLVADWGLAGDRLFSIVEYVLKAGCRWLLVRGKSCPVHVLAEVTSRILQLSEPWRAKVYVSGHPEVAAVTGAHGVHLPWGGDPNYCRRALGEHVAVGMSTHSLEEALQAERSGADYITLSPIFPSISKPGYSKSLGLEGLMQVVQSVRIPVVALGGVTTGRARQCLSSGARGVAVSGSVIYSETPYHVMAKLVKEVRLDL